MGHYNNPFSNKTYERIFLPWIRAINQKECLTICHCPKRDQLYRVYQFIDDKSFLKKTIFQRDNIHIIPLDLTALVIDDPQDIEKYIFQFHKKNKRLVLLILDADKLLAEKKHLISYFDTMFHAKQASLIYFFQKNTAYEKYTRMLASFSTFYQNTLQFPCAGQEDSMLFINYLEKDFSMIPDKIKKMIVAECGGNFWLVKQAVRYYSRTKDISKLFTHEDILIKLKILYDELEPEEQEVLTKTVLEERLDKKDKPYFQYLVDIKLINKGKTKYSLSIPLFEKIIREHIHAKRRLTINRKKYVELNGVPIDMFFSRREKRILSYLILHKNTLISRDKMAGIIWGEHTQHLYTDWALDQMIWRFRNKATKLHLNPNLIQTVKNKGFIFNQ
ncbi:MAG: helix-turn-helix domain-containing protein [bacterium]